MALTRLTRTIASWVFSGLFIVASALGSQSGRSIAKMEASVAVQLGTEATSLPIPGWYVVTPAGLATAGAAIEESVPNSACHATSMEPNDPLFRFQAHLAVHHAEGAWTQQPDAEGVLVAILDTGVAFENYSDGSGTYYLSSDLAGTCFQNGYDFVNDDDHPNDDNHHGTFMASLVAETTNNAMGAAGLARGACILPVKVLDAEGRGDLDSVVRGIVYAADRGADVILMSFAFGPGTEPGSVLDQALEYARDRGALLVAASGNDGSPSVSYPAASPSCIAVGAVRSSAPGSVTRTGYSDWGTAIDLVAFGGDAADRDGDGQPDAPLAQAFEAGDPATEAYYFIGGTSAAAANVASAAALLLAAGANPDQARSYLLSSCLDLERPGFDTETGFGLLDPAAALAAFGQGVPTMPEIEATAFMWLDFAGSQKVRIVAEVFARDRQGRPADHARVYLHFGGAFVGMADDGQTNHLGYVRIKSDWLQLQGVDPWTFLWSRNYRVTVDRAVESSNRFDPRAVAPSDQFPGSNIIIDNPIKDQ